MLVDSNDNLCNVEKLTRMRELESAHLATWQCPHESWFKYILQLEVYAIINTALCKTFVLWWCTQRDQE